MFEQELYNQETPAAPTQQGDLFHHYEIKTWEFSPRIYKIVGVAVLANLLFFTGVAQTNVMTMRGCESPFVGRVCQVLDMAYVGTVLFGTERDYVDMAYEKTDLGDAEITFINMDRNEPMFEYPPGYFQPEPEQTVIDPLTGFSTSGTEFAPGIPSNPTVRNNIPAQKLPKYNPNATTGDADGWGNDEEDNPTLAKGNNGRLNSAEPNPTKSPETSPTVEPTSPVADVDVTSRPYIDLGNMVNGLLENEAIALGEEFAYRGKGKLTKDGRLDPKTFRFLESKVTNPEMAPVLKRAFEAISESGHLKYLEQLSGKDLEIAISQDQTNLTALLQSEVESDTRARSIATLLKLGLQYARDKKVAAIEAMEKENNPEKAEKLQSDKDELALLQQLVINAEGKKLTINFLIPQDTAQQMIERKLADLKKKPKPSANAVNSPGNNTAVK
jgi:hypothetical protein